MTSNNSSQAYQLKSIRYQGSTRKILLQNENGPCPLLAAANALLLRGVITLDPVCVRNGVASTDDVVNMLANRALTAGGNRSEGSDDVITSGSSHHEYHLNEVLGLLPGLQHGMDVNPRFTSGPTGVEYTNNLAAFDLLGVELVHGWLLDPQDLETVSVVESKTYNEIVEVVIQGNEARDGVQKLEDQMREKDKLLEGGIVAGGEDTTAKGDADTAGKTEEGEATEKGENEQPSGSTQEEDVGVNPLASEDESPTNPENTGEIETNNIEGGSQSTASRQQTLNENESEEGSPTQKKIAQKSDQTDTTNPTPSNKPLDDNALITVKKDIEEMRAKMSELSLQITRAAVANAFLTSSGHQLTYHGLEQLHKHMGEDTLCVFFRNNHFATLTKHDGVLYLLVTDLGYANVPEIVWEKLDNIDGDTEHANEFFQRPTPRSELKPAAGPTIAPELLLAQRSQAESDYQLALAMSKGTATSNRMDDDEGKLIEAAKELSLKTYNGDDDAKVNVEDNGNTSSAATGNSNSQIDSDLEVAMAYQRAQQQSEHESEQLARQLQELEYARQRPAAGNPRRPARPQPAAKPASAGASCIVS